MRLAVLSSVLWSVLLSPAVWGDGGTVVLRTSAAPYVVTVFSDRGDWSVLVQDDATLAPVLDAEVFLEANSTKTQALLGAGTNRLLYSASGVPPDRVRIQRNGTSVSVDVSPRTEPPSAGTPLGAIAVVPATAGLFALNQFLKRRKNAMRLKSAKRAARTSRQLRD